jgi:hypothetical protein
MESGFADAVGTRDHHDGSKISDFEELDMRRVPNHDRLEAHRPKGLGRCSVSADDAVLAGRECDLGEKKPSVTAATRRQSK